MKDSWTKQNYINAFQVSSFKFQNCIGFIKMKLSLNFNFEFTFLILLIICILIFFGIDVNFIEHHNECEVFRPSGEASQIKNV